MNILKSIWESIFGKKKNKVFFGVMFPNIDFIYDKINLLSNLHVGATRMTISMDTWNGYSKSLEALQGEEYKVLLNVYWKKINESGTKVAQEFPTGSELDIYRSKLNEILARYKPEVLLIENEELVLKFHSGDISDYLNMLKVAVEVAHYNGVKIANGGITNPQAVILTYNWLNSIGRSEDADLLSDNAMDTRIARFVKNPDMKSDLGQKVTDAEYLIEGLKNIDVDYVNLHWYEPLKNKLANNTGSITPSALSLVLEYLNEIGKPVIIGECGQTNSNPNLTSSLLKEISSKDVAYAIWLSGDNGVTKALNVGLDLLPTGEAFVKFIDTY